MRKNILNFTETSLLIFLSIFAGCSRMAPPSIPTLSEAHKKFIEICRGEYNLNVVLKPIGNTVWIYVPIDQPILELKAGQEGPKTPNKASEKQAIRFIEGEYDVNDFLINYDIGNQINYPQDPGYGTTQSQTYTETQNHILTAIARAYFDVGTVPGDVEYLDPNKDTTHKQLVKSYIQTDRPPDFFVLVIADVVRGIEKRDIFFLQDYKRSYTGELPGEEFWKRFVADYAGNVKIIGDRDGRYIDYKDITLPEFLTKQILQRIRIKYQQSSFPPSADSRQEILSIVSDTLYAYQFTDYKKIDLHNLADGTTYTAGK